MKTLIDHLAQYGAYHRDPRNIATHFFGVPMIVLGVTTLLSLPSLQVGPMPVTLALLVALASSIFYFKLDMRFGLVMSIILGASLAVGQWIATQSLDVWLGSGFGLFIVGWAIQFLGHYYEGKKPAFVDDLVGLLIGPLFLVAEAAFAFRMRQDVQAAIEARVGPVRLRGTLAT
ncbi:MAG TPA: Mpo1-like protein [Polaromonas sp.]|uniref:Mpo1 family 2-hydroxy fatty acid dioxygenase n=1 Tax=Polaromonas sp. TaxID=1869339 RepID=UPI002D48972A|nr:Mpo1-like protein [Polaromonas sp.]HYW57807.1 Mpo1-like protein [Polaromonas sp.]